MPGNTCGRPEDCYPDDGDASDPEYTLAGEAIDVDDLPRGLETIADLLYTNPDHIDFSFVTKRERMYDDGPDYDDRPVYDDGDLC